MNKKGFTLIELLIVIAIIGIIAAIAIPNMLMALQKSRQKGSMLGLHNIATGLEGVKADRGEPFVVSYVEQLNRIDYLGATGVSSWLVPVHLSTQPNLDRWGNRYTYDAGAMDSWYIYQVATLGKDGAAGGDNAAAKSFPLGTEPTGAMEFIIDELDDFNGDVIFIDGMGIQVPSTGAAATT